MLKLLFRNHFQPDSHEDLQLEIEENHKILIQHLSKEDKKRVLTIIDHSSYIASLQAEESFVSGFRAGMELAFELKEKSNGFCNLAKKQ